MTKIFTIIIFMVSFIGLALYFIGNFIIEFLQFNAIYIILPNFQIPYIIFQIFSENIYNFTMNLPELLCEDKELFYKEMM